MICSAEMKGVQSTSNFQLEIVLQVQQPVQYGYLYKCIAAFVANRTGTNSNASADMGEYVYTIDGLDLEDD